MTGVGIEHMPILNNAVSIYMEPGQYLAGGRINPNNDHTLDAPGNLRAEFNNGVFTDSIFVIRDPNDTGVGWQLINDGVTTTVITLPGQGLAFWGYSVISWHRYVLETSVTEPVCLADFNDDGTVNVLDVVAFITNWNAQGPGADFDNSGSIDVLDVVEFITTWNNGCP